MGSTPRSPPPWGHGPYPTPVRPWDARHSFTAGQGFFRKLLPSYASSSLRVAIGFGRVRASRGSPPSGLDCQVFPNVNFIAALTHCPQRIRVEPKVQRRRRAIHTISLMESRKATEIRPVLTRLTSEPRPFPRVHPEIGYPKSLTKISK